MRRHLVDTGPLVALLNRRDRHHRWARDTFDAIDPPIFTCESVLSEACYLLSRLDGGQDAVLVLVDSGILRVDFAVAEEMSAVRALMRKFANVPMSLAEGCLVRMSEMVQDSVVVTLDGDFRIYLRNRRHVVPTLMPPQRRR